MSDNDDSKKRKITRACDICRRKKIKCDGPEKFSKGLKCSNCQNNNFTCTYLEAAKRKGPPKGYVESLENRNARFESLFASVAPGYDYVSHVGPPINRDTFETGCEADTSRWNKNKKSLTNIESHSNSKSFDESEDSDNSDVELEKRMQHLAMNTFTKDNNRYIGKSSSMYLLAAIDDYRPKDDSSLPDSLKEDSRPEFWMDRKWALEELNGDYQNTYTPQDLPSDDLIDHLVGIFFDRINIFFPFLHRPTFELDLKRRKHETKFGGLVILLCAAASRYSDDPRVVPKNDIDEFGNVKNWRFAGSEFHETFKYKCRRYLLTAATLEDLQIILLLVIYLQAGPFGHACWAINSVGLILAQDIGYHRRFSSEDPLNNEIRKRVFWCLYSLDRTLSAMIGRPCTLNDENFDVDLPSVLADEVDTPMQTSLTYFNSLIKLHSVLGDVLRTIYVINKRKKPNNFNVPDPKRVPMEVASLDSKLNKWLESVPNDLRWNPNCKDNLKFAYMCNIQTTYYLVQLYIHRPFISTPRRPSNLGYPSLSICTNAARSCIHVIASLQQRNSIPKYLDCSAGYTAFTCGIILIVSACEGRKNSFDSNAILPEMKEIEMGMKIVKDLEIRYLPAGRAHDVFKKLAKFGTLPVNGSSGIPSPATSNFSTTSTNSYESPLLQQLKFNNDIDTQRNTLDNSSNRNRKIAKKPSHGRNMSSYLANLPISTNDLANHMFYQAPGYSFNDMSTSNILSSAPLPNDFQNMKYDFTTPQPTTTSSASTFFSPSQNEYEKTMSMNLLNPTEEPTNNLFTGIGSLAQSEYDNFKMENYNQNLAATTSSPPMDMWSLVPQSVYDITSDEWAQFFQTFTQQQNNN